MELIMNWDMQYSYKRLQKKYDIQEELFSNLQYLQFIVCCYVIIKVTHKYQFEQNIIMKWLRLNCKHCYKVGHIRFSCRLAVLYISVMFMSFHLWWLLFFSLMILFSKSGRCYHAQINLVALFPCLENRDIVLCSYENIRRIRYGHCPELLFYTCSTQQEIFWLKRILTYWKYSVCLV